MTFCPVILQLIKTFLIKNFELWQLTSILLLLLECHIKINIYTYSEVRYMTALCISHDFSFNLAKKDFRIVMLSILWMIDMATKETKFFPIRWKRECELLFVTLTLSLQSHCWWEKTYCLSQFGWPENSWGASKNVSETEKNLDLCV